MKEEPERVRAENQVFEFHAPEKLIFGKGLASKAGKEAKKLGGKRVLLITDEGVLKAGLVDDVKAGVLDEGLSLVSIYSEVPQDSDIETCSQIGVMARKKSVDTIISVGGGSVIDTAKLSNILISCGGELFEYLTGKRILKGPLKPHITIPTTAGTGSEVGLAAIVRDSKSKRKFPFASRHLVPDIAILDPLMTVTLPPTLTAYSGIDALTHAVEAYTSTMATPLSESFSREAFRIIVEYLPKAFEEGSNIEARGQMLIAASLSGFALSQVKSLGICHAMAHALGGVASIPHSLACAIVLPVCMKYNLDHCAKRYRELASEIEPSLLCDDTHEAGIRAVEAITGFIRRFGIPRDLTGFGVNSDHLETLTEAAMSDVQIYGNPRPPTREEIRDLFRLLL